MHVPPLRSCELCKNRLSGCHILLRGITAYLSGRWALEGRGKISFIVIAKEDTSIMEYHKNSLN